MGCFTDWLSLEATAVWEELALEIHDKTRSLVREEATEAGLTSLPSVSCRVVGVEK